MHVSKRDAPVGGGSNSSELMPKWIFDEMVKTLEPAWDYIQKHQEQFRAMAGDDKTKILVDEFLSMVRRSTDVVSDRTPVDLVRMRDLASGRDEWFAMGREEKSYFINFGDEWNAVRWMEDQKKRHPEWVEREGVHLVKQHVFSELEEIANAAATEIVRLNAIINTPQVDDFIRAVSIEAEHQRQRWGAEGDAGKTPADWFWLVGYLAGKALHTHAAGNTEKAEHHIITTAAACANWHRNMFGKTDMRPGSSPKVDGND